MILRHAARRLVLLDLEGIALDVRQLRPSESVGAGDKLIFLCFQTVIRLLIVGVT
jgi:hypothetical protein